MVVLPLHSIDNTAEDALYNGDGVNDYIFVVVVVVVASRWVVMALKGPNKLVLGQSKGQGGKHDHH